MFLTQNDCYRFEVGHLPNTQDLNTWLDFSLSKNYNILHKNSTFDECTNRIIRPKIQNLNTQIAYPINSAFVKIYQSLNSLLLVMLVFGSTCKLDQYSDNR